MPTPTPTSVMTNQEEIEAIVGGYHGDPFRVLGPHPCKDGWKVSAFLPQAQAVEVVETAPARSTPMEREHPLGFFTALLPKKPEAYTLRVKRHGGNTDTLLDAYSFPPQLTDLQLYLHAEGTHYEGYNTLGAHLVTSEGVDGVRFAVWAPNAQSVCVVGDFNDWDPRRHPMRLRDAGIWELFVPEVHEGAAYKYNIRSRFHGYQQMKADPYGFGFEQPPKSASMVCNLESYTWGDAVWMEERGRRDPMREPMSVYELHLGSWLKGDHNTNLTYREMANGLVEYVSRMGYTHIELMPLLEHPFTGSWGYQVVGYFAPTSRFGSPQDFMYLVDRCHQAGIGIIMDWVPAHFPKDAHGLAFFDGTALYEHADPRMGEHMDWGTLIFNYGRNEVKSFLISNALFWLKKYHIDGLRVDAVASMLYLDYSRKAGEWIPNRHGGNENLEAIDFVRQFNVQAHTVPGAMTIAEESTAFPGVSRPAYLNGLGFTMKWNMGWMHDMLSYISSEPVHRKYHHHHITFSMIYAFTENFVLPISHDEVVHGKGSLLRKMPGDEWQRFANARVFLAYMYAHPGKKLLFMGQEIGQYEEWNVDNSVPWHVLAHRYHSGLQSLVRELNLLHRDEPAMHELDFEPAGFEWIDFHDADHSVVAMLRRAVARDHFVVCCFNFTPVPRGGYRFGVPLPGVYEEILNTDSEYFGGSNVGNGGALQADNVPQHGRPYSINVTLPPLGAVFFRLRQNLA